MAGPRKTDHKEIREIRNKEKGPRIQLDRERFEWERNRRIYGATAFGVGVYMTLAYAREVGQKFGGAGNIAQLIERYLRGDIQAVNFRDLVSDVEPFSVAIALMSAGMVFSGFDPTDVWDSVIPESVL